MVKTILKGLFHVAGVFVHLNSTILIIYVVIIEPSKYIDLFVLTYILLCAVISGYAIFKNSCLSIAPKLLMNRSPIPVVFIMNKPWPNSPRVNPSHLTSKSMFWVDAR